MSILKLTFLSVIVFVLSCSKSNKSKGSGSDKAIIANNLSNCQFKNLLFQNDQWKLTFWEKKSGKIDTIDTSEYDSIFDKHSKYQKYKIDLSNVKNVHVSIIECNKHIEVEINSNGDSHRLQFKSGVSVMLVGKSTERNMMYFQAYNSNCIVYLGVSIRKAELHITQYDFLM